MVFSEVSTLIDHSTQSRYHTTHRVMLSELGLDARGPVGEPARHILWRELWGGSWTLARLTLPYRSIR